MKSLSLLIFLACILTEESLQAQLTLGDSTTILFATVNEAKKVLTTRDDFVQRMSPFDRAARMKTNKEVSEEEYLAFAGRNVLEWNDAEKERVTSAFHSIQIRLEALLLPIPRKLFMVKTTGDEEGGAAYTRANAIIFPKTELTAPIAKLQRTICHELFHIMSRNNPDVREKLYAAIGFMKCDEVTFPLELVSRKITNPDAPRNDHCIRLQVGDKEHWAIPILFSSVEKYDTKKGGEFFNYLIFSFLLVERNEQSSTAKPIYDGQNSKLVGGQQILGFFEQIGENTEYIIHPEEILADNFALLVLGERNLPSPAIITKLKAMLETNRNAKLAAPAGLGNPRR